MNTNGSIARVRWFAALGGGFFAAFHLYYIFFRISYLQIGRLILLVALGVLFMGLAVYFVIRQPYFGAAVKVGGGILLVGMGLVLLGAVLVGLDIWAGAWLLGIAGEAISTLGLAWFGIGLLTEGTRPLWKWLPLIMAPLYFISWSASADSLPSWAQAYTPEWLAVAYAAGWVLLGVLYKKEIDEK